MSTVPPLNALNVRFPGNVDEHCEPEVASAIKLTFNGVLDLNQAVKALNDKTENALSQIDNLTEQVNSTTATGVTSFNALDGAVVYFPGLGFVNNQLGVSMYTVQSEDSGKKIIAGDSTPSIINLSSAVGTPWFTMIGNDSGSIVSLLPDSSSTINGIDTLSPGGFVVVFFDGSIFWSEGVGGDVDSGMGTPGFISEWITPTSLGNSPIDDGQTNAGSLTSQRPYIGVMNGIASVMAPPFNAKCDGVTDDTAAIQAALDAYTAIEFPSGVTCAISGTLLLNDKNIIYGNNATLVHSGASTAIAINGVVLGVFISNLFLSLNGTEPYGIDLDGSIVAAFSQLEVSGTGPGMFSVGVSGFFGSLNVQILSGNFDGNINFESCTGLYLQNCLAQELFVDNCTDVTLISDFFGSGAGDAISVANTVQLDVVNLTAASTNGIAIDSTVVVNATINTANGVSTPFTGAANGFITFNGNLWINGQAGISGTVATAKLTTLGADGSMTFLDGILVAQTPAT